MKNYRKILMFDTDKLYFCEGKERFILNLTTVGGQQFKAGLGICMDINYKDFVNFYEFPLAEYCRDNDVDVLLFPTAWLLQEEDSKNKKSLELAMELYEWWLQRLTPMINLSLQLRQPVHPRMDKEWLFVAADRIGKEDNTTYKGCSAAIVFNKKSSICKFFEIKGMLNEKTEGCVYSSVSLKR